MSAKRPAKIVKLPIATDTREPIKLDPSKGTGATLVKIIGEAVQQALNSQATALVLNGFVDGRNLQGSWGVRLQGMQLGEIYLMPQRAAEDVKEKQEAKEA